MKSRKIAAGNITSNIRFDRGINEARLLVYYLF